MFANYKGKHKGYEFKVLGAFYYLISILVTKYLCPEIDEERKKQNKNLEKLSSITHYIKENYQEEISLESVANHFGFTPAYLSRMFQKYANINYKTYLGNIRVDHALKQVINTGDPINTIAISSGFSDSRAFAKAFIKRYQMLPSEYRKMLLSKTEHNKR